MICPFDPLGELLLMFTWFHILYVNLCCAIKEYKHKPKSFRLKKIVGKYADIPNTFQTRQAFVHNSFI